MFELLYERREPTKLIIHLAKWSWFFLLVVYKYHSPIHFGSLQAVEHSLFRWRNRAAMNMGWWKLTLPLKPLGRRRNPPGPKELIHHGKPFPPNIQEMMISLWCHLPNACTPNILNKLLCLLLLGMNTITQTSLYRKRSKSLTLLLILLHKG